MVDAIDRKILDLLQVDATLPIAAIAQHVGLSAAPCWRRIKRLEEDGVIVRRVALVDRRKVNVPMTVYVAVKAPRHAAEWLNAFRRVIADVPEVVEAWRLTGEVDYLLRVVVPDIETYDAVYQRLISRLEFSDISSSIAMEEMKYTTAIPTSYLGWLAQSKRLRCVFHRDLSGSSTMADRKSGSGRRCARRYLAIVPATCRTAGRAVILSRQRSSFGVTSIIGAPIRAPNSCAM